MSAGLASNLPWLLLQVLVRLRPQSGDPSEVSRGAHENAAWEVVRDSPAAWEVMRGRDGTADRIAQREHDTAHDKDKEAGGGAGGGGTPGEKKTRRRFDFF